MLRDQVRAALRWAGALLAAGAVAIACTAPRVLPRPVEVPPGRMALPAQLTIASLGVRARVSPVGLTQDGEMEVPGTLDEVGWYEPGARPGELGNAVLAGHNVWNGRPAVFGGLGRLRTGDLIAVTTSMQQRFTYRVETVTRYPAASAPIGEVFGATDEPVLTLITCVGEPDRTGQFPDRLVVRARAARAPPR